MLCVSNHKTDVRPHSYLGLGGDQCVGCRLVSTADRPHCVELVLSSGSGGSWFLSAASEQEISEWRHSLCLAVSQGMQVQYFGVCFKSEVLLAFAAVLELTLSEYSSREGEITPFYGAKIYFKPKTIKYEELSELLN